MIPMIQNFLRDQFERPLKVKDKFVKLIPEFYGEIFYD